MRILTKSRRDKLNAFIEAEGLVLDDPIMCPSWAVTGALDLMNALEATLDQHIESLDADMKKICTIRDIAQATLDGHVIGDERQTLREILAVIEGVDEEGDL